MPAPAPGTPDGPTPSSWRRLPGAYSRNSHRTCLGGLASILKKKTLFGARAKVSLERPSGVRANGPSLRFRALKRSGDQPSHSSVATQSVTWPKKKGPENLRGGSIRAPRSWPLARNHDRQDKTEGGHRWSRRARARRQRCRSALSARAACQNSGMTADREREGRAAAPRPVRRPEHAPHGGYQYKQAARGSDGAPAAAARGPVPAFPGRARFDPSDARWAPRHENRQLGPFARTPEGLASDTLARAKKRFVLVRSMLGPPSKLYWNCGYEHLRSRRGRPAGGALDGGRTAGVKGGSTAAVLNVAYGRPKVCVTMR
jgi:hypothetical protein